MASIQLSIAEPCHENWNEMLPEEKGRFCLSCQKTVVDFTNMSDGQIFEYFKNYKGSTCGQLLPTQLDREINKPKTHSIGRWKYFWQVLLPAVFAFHKVDAQKEQGKVALKEVVVTNGSRMPERILGLMVMTPRYHVNGIVTDEQNNPLASATITSNNGIHKVSDSLGRFSIDINEKELLTISYIGFETKQFPFDSISTLTNNEIKGNFAARATDVYLPIRLKQVIVDSSNVVVAANLDRVLIGRMGGISIGRRISKFSKPTFYTPTSDTQKLSIFPNPIKPGQDFQIRFQTKKKGVFTLQIADASGKAITSEKLNIDNSNYTGTMSGKALQQAGIYFINILNPDDKKGKTITGKIVVQ